MSHRLFERLLGSRSRMRSGGRRVVGFGLSVFVSTAVSLASIPAMIAASGEAAWGAIALGQSIGTIGGVAVGYGWGWFGPSRIAKYAAGERRTEYLESLIARGILFLPVAAVAACVTYALAPTTPLLGVAGAVSTTSVGLSAAWYFVGLAKPFAMLALETLPRSVPSALGIFLMYAGHSAVMGPLVVLCGTVAALIFSSVWIVRKSTSADKHDHPLRSPWTLLAINRHGLASAFAATIYTSAPLAIVSIAAPHIQATFALVDRVRVLVTVAAAPTVTVLQGWVPHATHSGRVNRANAALLSASVLATALGLVTGVMGQSAINWFGNRQISVSGPVVTLLAACVAISYFQSVLEKAVLATLEFLQRVTRALTVGFIVTAPLIYYGAHELGVPGALGGFLLGLLVVVGIELFAYARAASSDPT